MNINTASTIAKVTKIVLDDDCTVSEAWESITGDYQLTFEEYLELPRGTFYSNSSSAQKQAWDELIEAVNEYCVSEPHERFKENELGDPVCIFGNVWGAWELLDGFDLIEENLSQQEKAEVNRVIERFKRVIPANR